MYKGNRSIYMSDHVLLLNYTDVEGFEDSEDSTTMLNWHLAYLYQQMPYIEISARSISLSLTEHLKGLSQFEKLKTLIKAKPNIVIPSLYTNYRVFKNPITSQIKPLFSFAPAFEKIMAYPYMNIYAFITNDSSEIVNLQEDMMNTLSDLDSKKLKDQNSKIVVIEDDSINGSTFDIFVSSYYHREHIKDVDDDKITDYMHDRLYAFDKIYNKVNNYMMNKRIHYFNHAFQNQVEKQVQLKKGDDIVSIDINCDVINKEETKSESPADIAQIYLSSLVDIINEALKSFNQEKDIVVVIEHPTIDKNTDHFSINIILRSVKSKKIITKDFDEMFFNIKSMFDTTSQMYVQYKERYSDRYIMPTGIRYNPLF